MTLPVVRTPHAVVDVLVPVYDAPRATALADGTRLFLRPAVPRDNERLRRMFYRLSPTTIYRRLFLPAPHAPHWAERFAAFGATGDSRQAAVALADGEAVGLANYAGGAAPDEAEMAIVVEDAWQGRGVGRALVAELAEQARRRGIAVFTARILGENARALRFVTRAFPGARVRWDGGEYVVRACLAAG